MALKADRRVFSDVDEDLIREPSTLKHMMDHLATITWAFQAKDVSTKMMFLNVDQSVVIFGMKFGGMTTWFVLHIHAVHKYPRFPTPAFFSR